MILSKADQLNGKGEVLGNYIYNKVTNGHSIHIFGYGTEIGITHRADGINPSTIKHSFNNGESWHTENEIKEALEAKSKSCENCKHKDEDLCINRELNNFFPLSIKENNFMFEPPKDFCCNKHEPK